MGCDIHVHTEVKIQGIMREVRGQEDEDKISDIDELAGF